MKTSFALEFSDALECADFFSALGDAFRQLANGAKRVVVAAVSGDVKADPDASDIVDQVTAEAIDPATGKPKRHRRTKAQIAADMAAEAAAKAQGLPLAAPTSAPAAGYPPDYLVTELRAAGTELLNAKGGPAVAEVLNAFGVKKYPECPPEKRQAMLDTLKAAAA